MRPRRRPPATRRGRGRSVPPVRADDELPAGDFAAWVAAFRTALDGEGQSDVPCDGCTACCSSSQFVHIGPDETDTLAHIPAELQFPAPGRPAGHVVLGYDDRGCCPMLNADGCSIYEHRPRTCRAYDCRVFAAAGVAVDPDNEALAARVRRWRFTYPTDDDRRLQDIVQGAADDLAGDRTPSTPASIAVRAVEIAVRHSVSAPPGA